MKFYLVNCENKKPEIYLDGFDYVHIKAHTLGKQVIIITNDTILHEDVIEKTQEEAQAILDSWINTENENPEKDDEGNDILQIELDIEKFKGLLNG